MNWLVTILTTLIATGGGIFCTYIVVRTNRQDRTLNQIELNVNSRLDRLLEQSKLDNIELGQLRPPNGEEMDPDAPPSATPAG